MEPCSEKRKQPLNVTIRNFAASAAILAASTFAVHAQDSPTTVQRPATASTDTKDAAFILNHSPSHLFLPQRLDSTYVGGGMRSGQGDTDSEGSLFEANLRLEDFAKTAGGLYLLTEGRKGRFKTVAAEDAEQYSTDLNNGTADVTRNNDNSYVLIGGGMLGALVQYTSSKDTTDKRYRIFDILLDDPITPLLQTSQRDLDSDSETTIKAFRAGYTYEPFSVMVGAFRRNSDSRSASSTVNALSGVINFSSTETREHLSESELKGYLLALEGRVYRNIFIGGEAWIASGERTFTEAYFSDVAAPPVINTFTQGEEDLGYKQFKLHVRANIGNALFGAEAGKRANDGSMDDQTFYAVDAGVKLGPFLLSGMVGKDALIGNTFFGGNAVIGAYSLEDLAEVLSLNREVRGMVFYGDPTYSASQSLANRVRHIERIAQTPGFLIGGYGWTDENDKSASLFDLAASFGGGVMLQVSGSYEAQDKKLHGTGYLHWNLGSLGVPVLLTGYYGIADAADVDSEQEAGALFVLDGGRLFRMLTGKE